MMMNSFDEWRRQSIHTEMAAPQREPSKQFDSISVYAEPRRLSLRLTAEVTRIPVKPDGVIEFLEDRYARAAT
jgi:hypothetical protein